MKILGTALSIVGCVVLNIVAHAQWTTATNDIYNSNSGNVGIGNTAPASKLHVTSGAGVVGIRVTQGSTPTVSAFQIEDASGAKLVSVTKEGFLSVIRPGGLYPTTPVALLDLQTESDDLIRGYNTATTGSVFRVTAGGAIYCNANNIYDPGNNRLHASSLFLSNFLFSPDLSASNGSGTDLRLNRDHYGVANVLVGFDATQGSSLRLQVKGKGYFSGNVGIGNTDPTAKLDVTGTANITGAVTFGGGAGVYADIPLEHHMIYRRGDSYAVSGIKITDAAYASVIRLHSLSNGLYVTNVSGAPGAITAGTYGNPHDGSILRTGYQRWELLDASFSVNRAWTGNGQLEMTVAAPTLKGMIMKSAMDQTANLMEFQDGAGAVLSVMNAAGGIAIGTNTVPAGYKLAVKGDVIAEKIKIKPYASGWPDYVFKSNYRLATLEEIEAFIKLNQHLPGVPSATEIEKNGLDVGDGQATLLKKVEELTLHLIEMNKQLKKVVSENESLKKIVDQLSAEIKK